MSSTHNAQKRTLQEWLHWFEVGDGRGWLRTAVLAIAVFVLSWLIVHKQYHGPQTEVTLAQAVTGRQVASGEGFTTLINYPQSFAWAREQAAAGNVVDVSKPLPDLHQAPMYPLTIAGALLVMPGKMCARLFTGDSAAQAGAGNNSDVANDYAVLLLNVILLWCAALQTFFLARKLFGVLAGVIAMCALLLSSSAWSAVLATNGAPLAMVLVLALFQTLAHAFFSQRPQAGGVCFFCGVFCGLLFLTDYAWCIALVVVLAVLWKLQAAQGGSPENRQGSRTRIIVVAIFGFCLATGPWIGRNLALTGNPLALGVHAISLKAGDPTAEPATVRASFSTDAPAFDFAKVGNKVLTGLQRGLGERFWSGGGLFLAAFFAAGFAYRFKDGRTNALRWGAATLLLCAALSQSFFDSGEGERCVWVCMAPLVVIFGAGFFLVIVRGSEKLATRAGVAALVLIAAQAAPLARDVIAPRAGLMFGYPPYLPGLFAGMGKEMARGRAESLAWMADVPAGASWYSGQRVWAQPATLDGFSKACAWQPVRALVLSPATLDKPAFGMLLKLPQSGGGWAAVYRALIAGGQMPPAFPLTVRKRVLDDFYVLIDPLTP